MLETYKAKLDGDHLIWQDEVPEALTTGKPIDVIVTVLEADEPKGLRPIGLAEGDFVVPDDFDDPLPPEIIALFEN